MYSPVHVYVFWPLQPLYCWALKYKYTAIDFEDLERPANFRVREKLV